MVNNKVAMPDSKCLSLPRSTHPSEVQVRNGPSQTGWMSVRVNLRIPAQLQKYLKTSSPSSDSLRHANTSSQQLWTSITRTHTGEKPSHSRRDSFWRVVSEIPPTGSLLFVGACDRRGRMAPLRNIDVYLGVDRRQEERGMKGSGKWHYLSRVWPQGPFSSS